MTPDAQQIVLHDDGTNAPVIAAGMLLAGAVALGAGLVLGEWYGIVLLVLGALLLVAGLVAVVGLWRYGAGSLRLTPQGLVHSHGDRQEILPPEAIEGIGLLRQGRDIVELSLWYDPAGLPELPRVLSGLRREPGRLHLAMVGEDSGCMSLDEVQRVRAFVQAHRLGEWRNRSRG
ncbi:hypothetical protein [Thermomonospora cellulosilytica]|uniref:Uncharacterized protein n=1 Tax=Thermomonospora cellulosilytica TaxID=1411118 RepID=A0A7W3MVZ2_9ACTN|nr:hypothetical protein [Thermomonospora cellulosilytica]MBA9002919.1 hypothetical protein [Thermomonospora cellulosilytica]